MVLNDFGRRAEWLDLVQQHGFGSTKAQQILLAVLTNMDHPLTADEIWEATKVIRPKTGRATVYRFIDKLSAIGLLQQVYGYRNATAYLPAFSHKQVIMICGCSGKVVYVEPSLQESLIYIFRQSILYSDEHQPDGFHLQIYGTCINYESDIQSDNL